MKNDKEYFGTLTGFDESTMNMILKDVREYTYPGGNGGERRLLNSMESILLNGSHICVMIPGDDEPKPKAVNEN